MFFGAQPVPRVFEEQYHCYSVAYADKPHLEAGDKIILPASASEVLFRMEIEYPMLFQLSTANGNTTHSGVLEFSAQEGSCFIPFWMMQNLFIEEGAILTVRNVSLPKATFVKLQPQHVDFLEITNPRVVLEHALRTYSCVTKGDVIKLQYNDKNYHFELKEVEPSPAACIIETDVNIDFDAPVGYVEPDYKAQAQEKANKTAADLINNMPVKQSRFGGDSDTSSVGSGMDGLKGFPEGANSGSGTRIVDGAIIKSGGGGGGGDNNCEVDAKLVAAKIGGTGVQQNTALPPKPPTSTYWAVSAGGEGNRLDGKAPSPLKDKSGVDVDVREVRAEAARKREEALKKERGEKSVFNNDGVSLTSSGSGSSGSVDGNESGNGNGNVNATPQKKKSLIGNKFSKRRSQTTAFGGESKGF